MQCPWWLGTRDGTGATSPTEASPPLLCLSLVLFPWQPNSLVCPGSPGQLLQKPQGLLSKPWSCPGVGSLTPSGNPPERWQSPPSMLPWGCPAAASLQWA